MSGNFSAALDARPALVGRIVHIRRNAHYVDATLGTDLGEKSLDPLLFGHGVPPDTALHVLLGEAQDQNTHRLRPEPVPVSS